MANSARPNFKGKASPTAFSQPSQPVRKSTNSNSNAVGPLGKGNTPLIFGAVFLGAGLILWMRSRDNIPVYAGSALTLHPSTDADQSQVANILQALKGLAGVNPTPTTPTPTNPNPSNPNPSNPNPSNPNPNNPNPNPTTPIPRPQTPVPSPMQGWPSSTFRPNPVSAVTPQGGWDSFYNSNIAYWGAQATAASGLIAGDESGVAYLADLASYRSGRPYGDPEVYADSRRNAEQAKYWFQPEAVQAAREDSWANKPEWQREQARQAGLIA